MSPMRISQLAERSGIPATTLRFYETAGLVRAERSPAGYRLYGEDAVRRLEFIGAAKHLGLALEEIAELVGVWESGACVQVKADLRPRIGNRLAEAEQRAAELAAFTQTLRGALSHLDALPDRDQPCDAQCGFLAPGPQPQPQSQPEPEPEPQPQQCADAEEWRSALVACTLSGDGMRERAAQWHRVLAGATRMPIPDGLRLTLPADRLPAVAALAADEQRCCPFFDFRLHLNGSELHLEVRVPEAGAELLADLFGECAPA